MPPRAIVSGTISFGLVSIPIKLYVATQSQQVAFHLIHATCGTRIRQQLYCPYHKRTIERSETVRGLEVRKGRWVTLTEEELEAVDAEANRSIEIQAFVPLSTVDPIYFEDAHYVGPGPGGEKPYALLTEAMRSMDRVGLAQRVHHGKEHLVLIRPHEDALVLHSLYYADEVRDAASIAPRRAAKPRPQEVQMARKLVEELAEDAFAPAGYKDRYRERLLATIRKKAAGKPLPEPTEPPTAERPIDLMEALRASLGRGGRRPPRAVRRKAAGGRRAARRAG